MFNLDSTDLLFEDFYEKAVSGIAAGISIQEFTEMCYDFFHLDIIIVDAGYRLISCAGNRPFSDPYWEILADSGRPDEETIVNDYLKVGYLDAISQSDGAIFVDWGVCREYPQTSGPIYVNGQLSGFISLLFKDLKLKEFSLKLNTALCRLCAILLKTDCIREYQTQNPVREVFATQLFDIQNYPKAPRLEDYRPFIDIRPPFLISVLRSQGGNRPVLEHVRGRARTIFPDIIYLHQEDLLYLFLHGNHAENPENFRCRLNEFLTEYNLQMGCSQIFEQIETRAIYIQQAEYALKTGCRLNPEKHIFNYQDYYIPSMLSEAADRLFPENAVPAELMVLRKFDTENQTDYTESLKVYLHERNNLNKAAARLHLHRNSLKYRLDKIADLTGISPDDPDTALKLQLGFLMLEMI